MTEFSELGLSTALLANLSTEGYSTPTPIQCQAIPPALAGRDVCGIAQTGTGKTAAFALPILDRLRAAQRRAASGACRVLVLSPTRELASQIADNFRAYGRSLPLATAVVFGGVAIGQQRRQLARGVDILVATPGRLLDLIDSGSLSLARVEILVLDEADRMLDLGFIHALRRIVKMLPRERQTMLFSATMPKAIATLGEQYLTDPVKVAVTPAATTVDLIEQSVVFVPTERKRGLLARMLSDSAFARVLVFTRTKHGADRVARHLDESGIVAAAIHGNKSQPQRERALAAFRAGEARVLVATDIAARGIDVDGVSHVVNFDLPNVPEDYVHRIGRTARAGAAGIAIALCSDEERPYLRDIEKLTRQSIPRAPAPAFDAKPAPIAAEPPRPPARHDGRSGRPTGPAAKSGGSLPAFMRNGTPGRPANPRPRRRKRPSNAPRRAAVL